MAQDRIFVEHLIRNALVNACKHGLAYNEKLHIFATLSITIDNFDPVPAVVNERISVLRNKLIDNSYPLSYNQDYDKVENSTKRLSAILNNKILSFSENDLSNNSNCYRSICNNKDCVFADNILYNLSSEPLIHPVGYHLLSVDELRESKKCLELETASSSEIIPLLLECENLISADSVENEQECDNSITMDSDNRKDVLENPVILLSRKVKKAIIDDMCVQWMKSEDEDEGNTCDKLKGNYLITDVKVN